MKTVYVRGLKTKKPIYATKEKDGSFKKISEEEAKGSTFKQLPLGAFKGDTIDFGGDTFSSKGDDFSSSLGTLESGNIYVSKWGDNILSVPMYYDKHTLKPIEGFQGLNVLKNKEDLDKVKEYLKINKDTKIAKEGIFSDLVAMNNAQGKGETYLTETYKDNQPGFIPGYKSIYEKEKDYNLNEAAVDHLFTNYHDRPANREELDYWAGKRVGDLEDTLAKTEIFSPEDRDKIIRQMQSEGKTYIRNQAELEQLANDGGLDPSALTSITEQGGMMFRPSVEKPTATNNSSTAVSNGSTDNSSPTNNNDSTGNQGDKPEVFDGNKAGHDIINNSNLSDDVKLVMNAGLDELPMGVEFDMQEVLAAFNKAKEKTIDPHFRELAKLAIDDIQNSQVQLQNQRDLELQQQRFNEGQRIRQAKSGLEASGMTFTGEDIRQLGAESAIPQTQNAEGLPTQDKFGGLFYEGIAPMQNRLIRTSSQSKYNQAKRGLGRYAEKKFGSDNLGQVGLFGYSPLGGVTGSLENAKQSDYAQKIRQLYGQYETKKDLSTNINP